jgi:ribosome modulation factor
MRRSSRGLHAGLAGEPIESCPHAPHTRDAREWRAAWRRGAAEHARRRDVAQLDAQGESFLHAALERGERPAWGL